MEENKTTRVNRSVNYYSDRPNHDKYQEKHSCYCEKPEYDKYPERPNYDHCPVKPEYDCYKERPKYDHCPERPNYDHYEERPKKHDCYDERPSYNHYEERPKKHDCYDERPNYDQYEERPKKHDCYDERPNYDQYEERPKKHNCYDERPNYDQYEERPKKHDCCDERPKCNHYEDKSKKHDCCDERPKCGCHQEKTEHDDYQEKTDYDPCKGKTKPDPCCCPSGKFRPNGCGSSCESVDVKCPDINCAVCTPILVDKVFDFQRIHQRVPFQLPNTSTFFVDARSRNCPCYQDNAPVCIEKIAVVYTCLGLSNSSIAGNICGTTVTLTGSPQVCDTCPSGSIDLFNNFTGTVSPKCCCNGKGSTGTLILPGLNASLCNYQYIVEGFIGCEPFTARAPQTPQSQAAFLTSPFSVFSDLCLPNCDAPVTLKVDFDLKYIARSIVPTSCFDANPDPSDCPPTAGTFTAQILAELLVNANLYATKQDVLTVFSAPTKFKHDEK